MEMDTIKTALAQHLFATSTRYRNTLLPTLQRKSVTPTPMAAAADRLGRLVRGYRCIPVAVARKKWQCCRRRTLPERLPWGEARRVFIMPVCYKSTMGRARRAPNSSRHKRKRKFVPKVRASVAQTSLVCDEVSDDELPAVKQFCHTYVSYRFTV